LDQVALQVAVVYTLLRVVVKAVLVTSDLEAGLVVDTVVETLDLVLRVVVEVVELELQDIKRADKVVQV
jgi:hypothetical protein